MASGHQITSPRDFTATRAALAMARHMPGDLYTSPEIYAREVETIFTKDWLCVGRVEEFEKPGAYRAFHIVDEPVIVCRDKTGALHAFANVCRHRGVEVVTGEGYLDKFSCPYHAWLYDLDGSLISAPHSEKSEGFDFTDCRLHEFKLDTWGGWIFVNLDSNAVGLADYLDEDGVRETAGFLRQESTRLADKFVTEVDCNWKLVTENFMDMYHTVVIHSSTFAKHFPLDGFEYRLTKHGFHAEYQSLTMAPEGVSQFGAMPWMDETYGSWMKGKGVSRNHEHYAFTTYVRPNFSIFGRFDLVQPLTYFPLGPERTRITAYTLFPEQHFALPDFDERLRPYRELIRAAIEEDREMVNSLQNGLRSRYFAPGPTVALEEPIHHFLNRYLDRMFGATS